MIRKAHKWFAMLQPSPNALKKQAMKEKKARSTRTVNIALFKPLI
jgi:hypothetical protein